ncbi:MAG TPA: YraN family protein [Rectinemataceae bacterium]
MERKRATSILGRLGEEGAAALLCAEGWTIVARNFRAGRGEIDIVAERGDSLAFVEVKAWTKNGPAELIRSLSNGKARRIIETSKIFLSKYRQYNGKRIRYDVVFLSSCGEPRRYEGAFDDSL